MSDKRETAFDTVACNSWPKTNWNLSLSFGWGYEWDFVTIFRLGITIYREYQNDDSN